MPLSAPSGMGDFNKRRTSVRSRIEEGVNDVSVGGGKDPLLTVRTSRAPFLLEKNARCGTSQQLAKLPVEND